MNKVCNILVTMPSAPDLILDLLVADGGMLTVQALCRAGALFRIGESAIRVGLTRLSGEDKIRRCGRGCYAFNRLGPQLSRTVHDWQHKATQAVPWNLDWLAVHDAGVLRSEKTAWRQHSLAMALRGFVAFQPGLHIRPNNLSGGLTVERIQLQALGLSPQALTFRLVDPDEERRKAAWSLWDVRSLEARYRLLQTGIEKSRRELDVKKPEVAVRESLLLGRAVIGDLIRDPLLPPQLMSATTRIALVKATTIYQRKARALWRQWLTAP
jgi:phenylacetic acid degradation operon negative regulatory protein